MKKVIGVAVFSLAISAITVPDLLACGEKILAMGVGFRYHLPPASILLYRNDSVIEAAIKHGGYKLHVAKDFNELTNALKSKNFQVAVADPSDVPVIQGAVESARSRPRLVQLLLGSPKANEREYIAMLDDAVRQSRK